MANRAFWLSDQKVFYIDAYSGKKIQYQEWSDVGLLMDLRQVAMRFHQGQYGAANWWFVLAVTLVFTFSTVAGLTSYLMRKPKGRWGFPQVPDDFRVSRLLVVFIIGLGVIFPMLGISLVVLFVYAYCSPYACRLVIRLWQRIALTRKLLIRKSASNHISTSD